MQFRTQIPIIKSNQILNYDSKIVSLGSCFAVNISKKLDYFKFQNYCNPFGILYHPVAIENLISRVVNKKYFTENDLFFYNEQWHCFEVHSELNSLDKKNLLADLNLRLEKTRIHIVEASHIIITYGTSWVYRNLERNEMVANCHKMPQKLFSKELLSVEMISNSVQSTIDLINSINKNVKFIFTISPVRHIKDGFFENNVSKGHLFSATNLIVNASNAKENISYFPSFEIMMDELRDYRFYADDLLHPSPLAIDYIWDYFKKSIISKAIFEIMDEVEHIQKALLHKPFNPSYENHQKFLEVLQSKIAKLQEQFLNFQF